MSKRTTILPEWIDNEATLKEFGYHPNELAPASKKHIVAICQCCAIRRITRKRDTMPCCLKCSVKKAWQSRKRITLSRVSPEITQENVTETVKIPLSRTYEATVSAIDNDIAYYTWHVMTSKSASIYAVATETQNGNRKHVAMHRLIMERALGRPLAEGEMVDHINMDTLDNRRGNLRLATRSQNGANRKRLANNKSGFKGVLWYKKLEKWAAQIKVNQKVIHLGYFDTPELAHEAYKQAAIKYHGEFARFE